MQYSQIEKSLPFYNDLYELKQDLRSLGMLRETISNQLPITISIRSKGQLEVSYRNLDREFSLDLIASLIEYKNRIKMRIEKELESIT